MSVNFEKVDKALAQLRSATSQEPANDLERDGAIRRFEYTIELLWKVGKKTLEENGISAIAPKDIIRELANSNWIQNPDELILFLKMRNEISHSYKEEVAVKVFNCSKSFVKVCGKLIKILKEKNK